MKPRVPSTCEINSVLNSIKNGMRLDGRELVDYRDVQIEFGRQYGTCQVILGNTRVVASVSAELGAPRPARPTEGTLQVQVDVASTAAAGAGRAVGVDSSVALERLLERCLRESRCVDTESLCIVADEKVWQLRLHVLVLDLSGSACDAASLAALAALCHFRRPQTAVSGREVRLCAADEADPLPLAVLHTPLLVTFAFFGDGEHMVSDPTAVEQQAMEGQFTVGMNAYREVCTLHLTGKLLLSKQQVLRCTELAAGRLQYLSRLLRARLSEDRAERAAAAAAGGRLPGLGRPLPGRRVGAAAGAVRLNAALRDSALSAQRLQQMEQQVDAQLSIFRSQGMSAVGEGGASQWWDDEPASDADEMWPPAPSPAAPPAADKQTVRGHSSGDDSGSDEEERTVLRPEDMEPTAEPGAAGAGSSAVLRCPLPAGR